MKYMLHVSSSFPSVSERKVEEGENRDEWRLKPVGFWMGVRGLYRL